MQYKIRKLKVKTKEILKQQQEDDNGTKNECETTWDKIRKATSRVDTFLVLMTAHNWMKIKG